MTDESAEIFSGSIVELLCEYPLPIGRDAIKHIKRTYEYLPAIATLKTVLDDKCRHQETMEKWATPALPAPKLTNDEEIVEALATRIRRRIDLPIIETDQGRALLKQAISKFLATTKKHESDLSILWLCDQGLLPPEQRPTCGQRFDVDKRMADAQRLGDVADALMRRAMDDFDREFGG